ncbi:RNA polymerase sigma factor [Bremerella alba]|uniref:RNA polymerase sigma-70 region 2 domain-containing protein n=1 Tax=Bremerella alba TaxID=980252 RepID=A0A7V9A8N4_9BACT|nr:sigma-70 family RNA polymerase sigma factor [Bremerella alba]MBA2116597.1 hypothetical protein [Bremerella alba]
MKASSADLQLLEDLLASPTANWRRFVDRYASTVIQVVQHARQNQKWTLTQKDADAVVVATFERLSENNLEILHRFDGNGSFTTFLTVAARRIVIQELQDRGAEQRIQTALKDASAERLQIPGTAS